MGGGVGDGFAGGAGPLVLARTVSGSGPAIIVRVFKPAVAVDYVELTGTNPQALVRLGTVDSDRKAV